MTEFARPYLSYSFSFWAGADDVDPDEVVRESGSPRLYAIHRASASWTRNGLRVTLEGPMKKRDGGRGQHSRHLVVDLGQQQPDWLTALIRDARARLVVAPRAVSE